MGDWETEFFDSTCTVLGQIPEESPNYWITIPKGGDLSEAQKRGVTTVIGSVEIKGKADVREELVQIQRNNSIESDFKINHRYFNS
ncbi:hypothetical protein KI372_03515 [Halobacterium salinarum]|uniref:hypothetical protein n=1 Tax=Halobacterium salinarum TaxID=2242 RepID=UPI001F44A8EC|nr:hypothetical protein [Halobacterium salinarum]MCF2206505.1 hypothetical protein [Halobacterium salinarum]MCF2240498.1 hypothetical protein [Halobacterium salinarum]